MDADTLKQLHTVELLILDEFVRICKNNNLTYFLIGGTLLGAVRHGGFIPWDDDVDVGMPREDYERFISICDDELGPDFYMRCYRNFEPYWFHYMKICKKNTLFAEHDFLTNDEENGIFIDIMPFDTVLNNSVFLMLQEKTMALVKRIIRGKIKSNKKMVQNPFLVLFFHFFSFRFLQNTLHRLALIFKPFKSDYYCLVSGGYDFKRETHLKSTMLPVKKILFEGKKYSAPQNHDVYLRRLYNGDYMILPPPEKRISHDPKTILFDFTPAS